MRSDKASITPIDEIYNKKGQGILSARCKFNKPLGLALLALDKTTRAEALPLFKLQIKLPHLRPLGLLERNNFVHNSPVEVSRLINHVHVGRLGGGAVSAHIVGFFNAKRMGIFRNLQYLTIEVLLHDLDALRLFVKTLIKRIHPSFSGATRSGRRRVVELVVQAADIIDDFWTVGEECEVEESMLYKGFRSSVKRWAASKGLDCEVQVFEDDETGEYSRLYFQFSRMS